MGGKMDFYKTMKKAAVIGFLTALPTVCNPSCEYKGNKTYAAEVKQEVKQEKISERVRVLLEKMID